MDIVLQYRGLRTKRSFVSLRRARAAGQPRVITSGDHVEGDDLDSKETAELKAS